jgi:hypothetical protein
MRKIIVIAIVASFCFTTLAAANPVHTETLKKQYDLKEEIDESNPYYFTLPVWVSAIPKIFISGKPVFFLVVFPNFLVDGKIQYDFDDGTFSQDKNFVKHRFLDSGTYVVNVEFDTIFGLKAQGKTRVFII